MKFTASLLSVLVISSVAAVPSLSQSGRASRQNHKARKAEAHHDDHDHKTTIGLAMNGGSNTAANGGSAVMRGIQRQKIKINGEERPGLEAFDYISALSGGNIPNVLYHFSQFATTDELLDLDTPGYTDPTTITMEELGVAPPIKSIFSRSVVDPFPFFVMAVIYATTIGVGRPVWPTVSAFSFLHFHGVFIGTPITSVKIRDEVKSKPFCQTTVIGPTDVFPAWVDNKISRGVFGELYREAPLGALKLNHISDGVGVPVYEMNITYVMSLAEKHGYQLPIPAFGSHEALHVPFSAGPVTMKFDAVENETDATSVEFEGFVAPYDELSTESDPVTVEKVLGMATDMLVLGKPLRSYVGELGNTPITVDMPTADGGKRSMAVTDGGYYDNSGLPALLQQGVRKIVFSFVPSFGAYLGAGGLGGSLLDYFGLVRLSASLDSWGIGQQLHHLFNNENSKGAGKTRFEEMMIDFYSLREAGEPMITTLKDLEVVDNPLFGIKGGWTVDLTIIAGTEVPMKFVEMLPAGVAEPPIGQNKTVVDPFGGIRFTNEEFLSVPNVVALPMHMDGGNYTYTIPGTDTELVLEGVPGLGFNLPVRTARMTELMLTWMIEYAWDKPLVGSDGEVKFDGFRAFLEEEPHAHDDDEKEEDGSDSSSNFARTSPFMYLMVLAVSMLYWII